MSPIHVCIITTAHPIDDVRVNHKMAQAMLGAGLRVSWVGPGHAFYDSAEGHREGIEFHLTKPIRSKLDRVLSRYFIKALSAGVEGVDVYFAPDPDSAPIALALARGSKARVIFDIHEMYHGALLDRWSFGIKLKAVRDLVRNRIRRTCARCDLTIAVSQVLLNEYCPDPARGMVVRSCAPAWFATGEPALVRSGNPSSLKLMHGKTHLARGTIAVMKAVGLAHREAPGVSVVMLSEGDPSLDASAKAACETAAVFDASEALDLRAGVPMQGMPAILRTCDAGIIAYDRALGAESLPNRLFEYMAVGLPIIAPIYSDAIAEIINQEACGLLVDSEDPEALAGAILTLQRDPQLCIDMGRRGRKGFLERHNWDAEVAPLLNWILGHSGRSVGNFTSLSAPGVVTLASAHGDSDSDQR